MKRKIAIHTSGPDICQILHNYVVVVYFLIVSF